jgi:iron-sulfur cluster assembly protein
MELNTLTTVDSPAPPRKAQPNEGAPDPGPSASSLTTLGGASAGAGLTTLGAAPAPRPPAPARPIVTLTPSAIDAVRKLMSQKGGAEKNILRMGVRGGGCSGLSYVLQIETRAPAERDRVLEFEGVRVAIDPKSLLYLAGTELDCSDDLLTGGFEFRNPLAKRGCGCGTSFTV